MEFLLNSCHVIQTFLQPTTKQSEAYFGKHLPLQLPNIQIEYVQLHSNKCVNFDSEHSCVLFDRETLTNNIGYSFPAVLLPSL